MEKDDVAESSASSIGGPKAQQYRLLEARIYTRIIGDALVL